MSWLESVARAFLPQREDFDVQTRALDPTDFETQLANITRTRTSPWRIASVKEALGVPSILGAVSLIANTVGTLSLEAFRLGELLPSDQTPRIVIRPNPLTTPFRFFRDSAFYKASRGERWWWVAARDIDNAALSLYPVPPWEVTVEANDRNPLRPTIRWRNRIMANEDMVHDMYLPDETGLRGVGPLQLAGAAVSVAVEAQEWAANFFALGGMPPALIKSAVKLTEEEAQDLKSQWAETPNNMPKVVDPMIEDVKQLQWDQQSAQFNDARQFQVGEVARMFGMPGPLLEYQMSGQSLTYRNEADIWSDFQRRCLSPHYLEPMEQDMSDLLTRATVARFNLDQLLRADTLTRYQTWAAGIQAGFLAPAEARRKEGLDPGSVDFAPVPQAPPQAVPNVLPFQQRSAASLRCPSCNKFLAELATPPYRMTCPRCKTIVADDQPVEARSDQQPQPAQIFVLNQMPEQQPVSISEGAVQVEAVMASPDMSKLEQMAQQNSEMLELMRNVANREPVAPVYYPPPVEVPTDTFVAAVQDLRELMAAPRKRTILRDKDNNIIGTQEEIA